MTTKITVNLPDELYHRVERLAQLASRDIADVLADAIKLSIPLVNLDAEVIESISLLVVRKKWVFVGWHRPKDI